MIGLFSCPEILDRYREVQVQVTICNRATSFIIGEASRKIAQSDVINSLYHTVAWCVKQYQVVIFADLQSFSLHYFLHRRRDSLCFQYNCFSYIGKDLFTSPIAFKIVVTLCVVLFFNILFISRKISNCNL